MKNRTAPAVAVTTAIVALLFMSSQAQAQAPCGTAWRLAATETRTLDGTAGRQMPDAPELLVVYEYPTLWGPEVPRGQRILTAVTDEKLDALAARIIDRDPAAVLIDIEQSLGNGPWSGDDNNDATRDVRRANYIAVITGLRDRGVTQPIGGYATGTPAWGRLGTWEKAAQVRAYAAGLADVVEHFDFVCIVAYTRYDATFEPWSERFGASIEFCREQWPDHPVMVLLWPLFHDYASIRELRETPNPWHEQTIDWAHENADLVGVWAARDQTEKHGTEWVEESLAPIEPDSTAMQEAIDQAAILITEATNRAEAAEAELAETRETIARFFSLNE